MSNEAATVFWFPAEAYRPTGPRPKPTSGKDRTFESVDSAVTFVMERLEENERANAYIATDSSEIEITAIRRMYAERKKKRGA